MSRVRVPADVVARLIAVAMIFGAATLGAAIAHAAPLPPDRPADLPIERLAPAPDASPAVPTPVPPTPAPPALPVDPGPACLADLASAGIVVEPAPQPTPDNQACQVEVPVRIVSVRDTGERGLVTGFPDRPVVACRYVRPLADWLAGIALPVLGAAHGAPVKAVQTGPGAQCRPRDRISGEKLSAHATGLALDIASFTFADGKTLPIKPRAGPAADTSALLAVRRAACGWFTTVLGPGSDPYHADHFHLDIQQHGSTDRYRICQ